MTSDEKELCCLSKPYSQGYRVSVMRVSRRKAVSNPLVCFSVVE